MSAPKIDILVLGASLLGVELVHQLRRHSMARKLRVTVVDRLAEHAYIPLCQERLTDRISVEASTLKTRAYVEQRPHHRYVVGEVTGLDPDTRTVTLADGTELCAKVVVVALGSEIRVPDAVEGAEHAHVMKFGPQIDAAHADLHELLAEGGAGGRIVVVGGGITGVELAGELGHWRQQPPPGTLAPAVTLVQGAERLLPHLTPRAGRLALRWLERQGVDVRLGTRVKRITEDGAELSRGGSTEQLQAARVYWAGGVAPAPILERLGLPRTEHGWLRVGPTLQCFPEAVPDRPAILAGGDAVRIVSYAGEWNTMQRAIEAIWQAKTIAHNATLLALEPDGFPDGLPGLKPHRSWSDFAHGVSVGRGSLMVWGPLVTNFSRFNTAFRRFLMRQYLARYRGGPAAGSTR